MSTTVSAVALLIALGLSSAIYYGHRKERADQFKLFEAAMAANDDCKRGFYGRIIHDYDTAKALGQPIPPQFETAYRSAKAVCSNRSPG